MLLEGMVAYISGGAGTIGTAMARRFCEEGASVVVGDADELAAHHVAHDLTANGFEARSLRHDVTSAVETETALAACRAAYGRVDIVCANAGIARFAPVLELTPADWQETLDINVTGVFRTLQVFGRALVQQGAGAIIVTASISSLRGDHSMGAYSASKFAVLGLVESMAKEVAAQGVRVNCICPGPVEGAMVQEMVESVARADGRTSDDVLGELTSPIALGRLVQPDEVADAAVFLASPLARFITGTTVVVDGGMLA